MALYLNILTQLHSLWLYVALPAAAVATLFLCAHHVVVVVAHNLVASRSNATPARRGRQRAMCHAQLPEPFHPDAPQQLDRTVTALDRAVGILDQAFATTLASVGALTPLVRKVKQAFAVPNIEPYVTPLRIRVRRGIAQVSGLPGAFTQHYVQYRYLCPASLLVVVFFVLVLVAGVSVGFAGLACCGGCLVLVAGDKMGEDDEEESRVCILDRGVASTPDMGNEGPIAVLHEQT